MGSETAEALTCDSNLQSFRWTVVSLWSTDTFLELKQILSLHRVCHMLLFIFPLNISTVCSVIFVTFSSVEPLLYLILAQSYCNLTISSGMNKVVLILIEQDQDECSLPVFEIWPGCWAVSSPHSFLTSVCRTKVQPNTACQDDFCFIF